MSTDSRLADRHMTPEYDPLIKAKEPNETSICNAAPSWSRRLSIEVANCMQPANNEEVCWWLTRMSERKVQPILIPRTQHTATDLLAAVQRSDAAAHLRGIRDSISANVHDSRDTITHHVRTIVKL
eukprot:GHVU01038679.1.p1 GENE.GHVU01038679.1~~GHVU01038679.1.p1  ORF type:complete len:126 (-),score=8.67 GHVU01038679.1:1465-1842(-)